MAPLRVGGAIQSYSTPEMEFQIETAGESHGAVLTAICYGIPAGSPVSEDFVNQRLAARQVGHGSSRRQEIERDRVRFLSGVRDGRATGNPITLQVANKVSGSCGETMTSRV